MRDRNLYNTVRSFSRWPEDSQLRTVYTLKDLAWGPSARLLAALFEDASDEVKLHIVDACGQIEGKASKALLMRAKAQPFNRTIRWATINALTAGIHSQLSDMGWLYEVAQSSEEFEECRETATYGLARVILDYRLPKSLDRAIWLSRLLELWSHVRAGDEELFEHAVQRLAP